MHCGDEINVATFKKDCLNAGYTIVNKVMEPGECAFRGSLIDVFPTGIQHPLRIDLLGNEIESIKLFEYFVYRKQFYRLICLTSL